MGIISWIILGLIAGFVGSKIVNRQGQGFWLDVALGIVGAPPRMPKTVTSKLPLTPPI